MTNLEIPVVGGFLCTGRHYTDDNEMTACAGYSIDNLPDEEELVDALDEVTCPAC